MEITETKEAVTKAPFSAWVGNLHAYTEGKTEGRWIDFPQSKGNLQKAINDISKNGAHEIFIADYDFRDDCTYLNNIFSEYSSISELNVIAKLIGSVQHPAVEAYLSQDDGVSLKQLANLYMQESEIPYHTFSFKGSTFAVEKKSSFASIKMLSPISKIPIKIFVLMLISEIVLLEIFLIFL